MKLQGLWPVERHGLFGFLLPCDSEGIGFGRLQSTDSECSRWNDVLPTGNDPIRSRGMVTHSLSLTDTDFISRKGLHDGNPGQLTQSRFAAACSREMNRLVMLLSSIISDPNEERMHPC